ncbi:MAG: hypothetical protein IT364_08040 [Candidatus Hydrogenedentes bacterium]|nr:hypothetical protein [Candidatus Hydrogenedentota bacterium]
MSLATDCLTLAFMNLPAEDEPFLITGISNYLRMTEMEQILYQRELENRIISALNSNDEARCPCCEAKLAGILQSKLLSVLRSQNTTG